LAWLDIDPEGVRVHRATVESIEPASTPSHWRVAADRGITTVDASGVGPEVVPLDPDIDADLYVYGDGFLVTSTMIGMEQSADADTAIDRGDDLDLG
jgi:hypothetical protein